VSETVSKSELEGRKLWYETEQAEQDLLNKQISNNRDALKFHDESFDRGYRGTLDGHFRLYDYVYASVTEDLMREIDGWEGLLTDRDEPERKLVTLDIRSYGGSVFAGLSLMDYLEHLKKRHNLQVRVQGVAASMAVAVLQAGHIRSIGKHGWLMIHSVSSGTWGKLYEMEVDVAHARELNAQYFRLLHERATKSGRKILWTPDELIEWTRHEDRWISAKDAYDMGLVDFIDEAN